MKESESLDDFFFFLCFYVVLLLFSLSFLSPATVLGKGGFGEVFKALYNEESVAIKVFSPRVAELHNTTPNQLIRQEVSEGE